jgi:hypothetical protein
VVFFLSEAREASGSETARVHHPHRRRVCVAARGALQQSATPVIGFLNGGSPGAMAPMVTAFHRGLKEGARGLLDAKKFFQLE